MKQIWIALALTLPAWGITTRTFRVTTYKEFEEGEAHGVLLSSLGEATSGFATTRVDLPEAAVFSSTIAPDGTIWLGTGDSAQLYAHDAKGLHKIAKLEGVLVAALTAARDGTVYAGTLPGGKIFAVQRDGTQRELAKLEGADQIWALVLDADERTIYAATGPNGKLYAVDVAKGKGRVLWESGERHLLSLVRTSDGALVAGSADEAILYRILPGGTARALHDFEGDEVRAVAAQGSTLFVAVNEFEKKNPPPANAAAKPHGTKMVLPATPPPLPPPGRDRKGKGAIYRIESDGRVEQIFALAESYFTALALQPDGSLFAAAGANGRAYLIAPDRTLFTALDLPERQILTLAGGAAGVRLVGTGDAGALYLVDPGPPQEATFTSKVLDAQFPAEWGQLHWASSGPVVLETRSGNTSHPDPSWSRWQAPRAVRDQSGAIASPNGRYAQFRARFGKAGILRDATIYYASQNQRPRVVEIAVGEDPNGRLVKAARTTGKPRSPLVKMRWKAENPDEDELVFRLAFRLEGEKNWKALGGPEPLTAKEFEWNTEAIPDGIYELRVTASDERANGQGRALEHSLLSAPLLIDNRKPEVVDLSISYPVARATARDSFSPVSALEFAIDGGEFHPLLPSDHVFDTLVEPFSIQLPDGLAPGEHTLAVRALDAADNIGAIQQVFRVAP